jgi:hypothetical protein
MRITIYEDYIYLSAECEAEKLQIRDAVFQLQRYKIAHKFWGGDSIYIYTKSQDQYNDEQKNNT